MSREEENAGNKSLPGERIGRRLGIGLFWLLAVYMVGMSAASIIPSLYWPALAPRADSPPAARCAREIDALARDLLDTAANALRRGEIAGLERSLRAWDERAMALDGGCGVLEPARRDLLQLRTGIATLLSNYRSGTLPAQQDLQRTLDAYRASRAQRPKT